MFRIVGVRISCITVVASITVKTRSEKDPIDFLIIIAMVIKKGLLYQVLKITI